MSDTRGLLNAFISDTLIDHQDKVPWKADFRGSTLPACQRQLMLSDFYRDEICIPRDFSQSYNYEVSKSIKRLVQATWARQSLLWGDWQCTDRENCGAFYQNTVLDKGVCHRCHGQAEYVQKIIKDESVGFSGRCDGVVWCDALNGFVVAGLKARNHNVIKEYDGKQPYDSDIYQAAAYATLISRQYKINVVGRMILWIGKPKPRPYQFWYYDGRGSDMYEAQVNARKSSQQLVAAGQIFDVPCRCRDADDVGGCPFGSVCFSPKRDDLMRSKHQEWMNKK